VASKEARRLGMTTAAKKDPALKSLSGLLWSPTRSCPSGKADVVREETSTCTSQDRRGTGPSLQEKTRSANVGKDHLAAGTDDNLQRPRGIRTTEATGRNLVWRMSS
jgi:hypothetical protein